MISEYSGPQTSENDYFVPSRHTGKVFDIPHFGSWGSGGVKVQTLTWLRPCLPNKSRDRADMVFNQVASRSGHST